VHEGLDRGQPGVSGGGLIAARALQVLQECQHERRVDVLQVQLGRRDLELRRGVLKKQSERVGVGLAGMDAGAALVWQALTQECCDVWGQWSHAAPPCSTIVRWLRKSQ
jgi:hypothetical protein